MEKSVAEGWQDGCYDSEDSVKLLAEQLGLSFAAIKRYYKDDRGNEL